MREMKLQDLKSKTPADLTAEERLHLIEDLADTAEELQNGWMS